MEKLCLYISPFILLALYSIILHLLNKLKNLPPSPFPALPFIGHIYLLKKPFHRSLSEIARRHGPALFLRLGSRPVLLISSPYLAEQCLTKRNDKIFANRPDLLNGRYFGYNYTSLSWAPYGEHWRNLRRISSLELLSSQRLHMLAHVRADETLSLVGKLFRLTKEKPERVLDVKSALFEFMFNVLTRMITGKRYYGKNVENSKEVKLFEEIASETSKVAFETNVVDFLPLMKWFGLKDVEKKLNSIHEKRDKFMQKVIDDNRKMIGDSYSSYEVLKRRSMVQVLLDLQKSEPAYYTDETIKNLLLLPKGQTIVNPNSLPPFMAFKKDDSALFAAPNLDMDLDIDPCIVVHHGGKWVYNPNMTYVGGQVKIFNDLPPDLDGKKLKEIINSLGYSNVIKIHYCDPLKTLESGIRFLDFDDTTFTMFLSVLHKYNLIDMFTEHDEECVELTQCESNIVSHEEYATVTQCESNFTHANADVIEEADLLDHVTRLAEEVDYDEEGSDNEDCETQEARQKTKHAAKSELQYLKELESLGRVAERSRSKGLNNDSEYEDDSSEMESPPYSDDEEDCGHLLPPTAKKLMRGMSYAKGNAFIVGKSDSQSPFFLGQQFDSAVEFRKAITDYCVSIGRDVDYRRNDKNRIGAACKAKSNGCPWYIWASFETGKNTFVVKTHVPHHNCGRLSRVKKISCSWIASSYHKKFKVNPYLKCQEVVDTIWSDLGIKISLWLALKARKAAQNLILGEYKEQYSLLHRYAQEILRSNTENTIKFKLDNNVFERVYICFAALKKGFLTGCRPFFGIDGCFLKGPYGGQLLVAVGRDGNNQMYPIAWACVEVENTETWSWFLQLLADDLGTSDGHGYTIMSDQQKGLLKAVSDIWPRAETRVCARHVYCNFRQVFGGGLQYRRGFWKIAKSTTENDFKVNMQLFSEISNLASNDLMKRNHTKWVRAFFTPHSRCDSIDNNMNEVFNAYILSSRHKPIITMLEDIREGLMERLHKKRDFIAKKDILICPRIQQKLEKSKLDARGWSAFWDGNFSYGVREGATQTRYVVSLLNRTCSCNAWQLSGVPCNHAVAAIWKAVEHPEHYVASCFTKDAYLKAYQFPLEPLNGPQEWPTSPYAAIEAPQVKKVQNRPIMKRKPSLGEVEGTKLSRQGQLHKCSNCGEKGHNKRKCPMSLIDTPTAPQGPSNQQAKQKAPREKQSKQKQPTKEKTIAPSTQESQTSVLMHNRGVGVYTYPNGYQRQAMYKNQSQAQFNMNSNLTSFNLD